MAINCNNFKKEGLYCFTHIGLRGDFWVHREPLYNHILSSQCIGEQCFEYAFILHKGALDEGNIIEESRKYTIPIISAQIDTGKGGTLKGDTCFINLKENKPTILAIKKQKFY